MSPALSPELSWSWAALLLLGATHGINPGMGWLFAVGLGLQEQDRRAVWRALPALAAGHALAVAAAVAVAAALGRLVPLDVVKWLVAVSLTVMGVRLLLGHRHPRFGGMKVSGRELTMWSFLMASAHGAGLMAVPFVLGASHGADAAAVGRHAAHLAHAAHALGGAHAAPAMTPGMTAALGLTPAQLAALAGTALHSIGYLLVTGLVAVVVYERLGLRLLRRAWINVDLLWAMALVVTAVVSVAT